jgi:hypothetical protein
MSGAIQNPFEAIAEITKGIPAAQIIERIELDFSNVSDPNREKLRWFHTLYGATYAFVEAEQYRWGDVGRDLVQHFENLICAKDCQHVEAN